MEKIIHDSEFRYQLLDRLRSDCNYYLGWGQRNKRRLWAGDEKEQIEKMLELYHSFEEDEKPQWITLEEILQYKKKMLPTDNSMHEKSPL